MQLLLLLVLLLWGYCLVEEEGDKQEQEQEHVEEEKKLNVVEITPENFESIFADPKNMLIKYYAPWCGHCRAFAPVYEELAESLAESMEFYEVNCEENRVICDAHEIRGFPTIRGLIDGAFFEYRGPRDKASITQWIEDMKKPFYIETDLDGLTNIPDEIYFVLNNASEDTITTLNHIMGNYRSLRKWFSVKNALGSEEKIISMVNGKRTEFTEFSYDMDGVRKLREFVLDHFFGLLPDMEENPLSILQSRGLRRFAFAVYEGESRWKKYTLEHARKVALGEWEGIENPNTDYLDHMYFVSMDAAQFNSFVDSHLNGSSLPAWIVLSESGQGYWAKHISVRGEIPVEGEESELDWFNRVATQEVIKPEQKKAKLPLARRIMLKVRKIDNLLKEADLDRFGGVRGLILVGFVAFFFFTVMTCVFSRKRCCCKTPVVKEELKKENEKRREKCSECSKAKDNDDADTVTSVKGSAQLEPRAEEVEGESEDEEDEEEPRRVS